MILQPVIQEKTHIQSLPFGNAQTIIFTNTKEKIDKKGKPTSTTFQKTVEIISLGEVAGRHKYCFTCLEADFSHIRQPDPSMRLQLLILEVFDLLVVSTNKTETLIQIHNFGYLQEVWKSLRTEILQDYDDASYLMLVYEMDVLMQNHESVVKYLSLPSNYGLYFNGYKNSNLDEPIHSFNVAYGEELSNMNVEEQINIEVTKTKTQQLVTFQITGSTTDEYMYYRGSCVYLDGQLDICSKEIKTEFSTFNYSAKWVGLKKSFLQ
ncbi:hypothetical protein [Cytophaga aurantiaca]|uniref:hypothetical protein n=1 Tax=Cytophaga aurantiaca TaxID=29530 RepID=UPI00037C55AC|nr:hypothetical protein [Cytophaga aurantiaca]